MLLTRNACMHRHYGKAEVPGALCKGKKKNIRPTLRVLHLHRPHGNKDSVKAVLTSVKLRTLSECLSIFPAHHSANANPHKTGRD